MWLLDLDYQSGAVITCVVVPRGATLREPLEQISLFLGSWFLPLLPAEKSTRVLFVYNVSHFKGHPEAGTEGQVC